VKILSFHISKKRLLGIVYQNGLVESQFDVSLNDFSPLFFQKLGIDLKDYYLSCVIVDPAILCKEAVLTNVPQNAIKKLIPFYESSLFPMDDKETFIITNYEKIKKSFHVSSFAILKQTLDLWLLELQNLSITIDTLLPWQKALEKSIEALFDQKKEQLIFYFNDDILYILHRKNGCLMTSTTMRYSSQISSFNHMISALKQNLSLEAYEAFLMGEHLDIEKTLTETFGHHLKKPLLSVKPSHLILLGASFLAEKNKNNLLKNISFTKSLPLDLLKNTLIKINKVACTCALALSLFIFVKKLYEEKNQLSGFSTQTIDQSLETFEKLKVYKTMAIEAPSPLDIMAYFSSHGILNKTDSSSTLSASFSNFRYELLSPQKAKVSLNLTFPQEALRCEFEKHLKLKKIPFTCINTPHSSTYDMEFSKQLH
jgi:hypothetical protein